MKNFEFRRANHLKMTCSESQSLLQSEKEKRGEKNENNLFSSVSSMNETKNKVSKKPPIEPKLPNLNGKQNQSPTSQKNASCEANMNAI